MTCPNCGCPMNYINLDRQNILHCSNCAASFFEGNGINRISSDSARKLAADKKTDDISGQEKLCPNDHSPLLPMRETEAVPNNITLLKCHRCQGVFVFPDDLLAFKKAQVTKVEFFKAWAKPLPSLRTVLVISFTVVVLGTIAFQSGTFINRFGYKSQASDLITKINFSKSGRYLLIFFKTKTSFKSKIVFVDKITKQTVTKIISDKPTTVHQLITGDLNLKDEIWYQIILANKQGVESRTDLKKLSFD